MGFYALFCEMAPEACWGSVKVAGGVDAPGFSHIGERCHPRELNHGSPRSTPKNEFTIGDGSRLAANLRLAHRVSIATFSQVMLLWTRRQAASSPHTPFWG